jgi:hypothetical protein
MPSDDRIGFHENECFGPVAPDPTNHHPEQAIESIQLGAWPLAFVHGKLLSKSDRLHCQTVSRDQERPYVPQHREQSSHHQLMLICIRRGSEAVDSRDWSSFDDPHTLTQSGTMSDCQKLSELWKRVD